MGEIRGVVLLLTMAMIAGCASSELSADRTVFSGGGIGGSGFFPDAGPVGLDLGSGSADESDTTDIDDIGTTDGADPDATDTDDSATGDDDPWPPEISKETDTAEVTPEGGAISFLDGEITLEIQAGAFEDALTLSVTRKLVSVDEGSYVGYIWGRHGMPIDPPAHVIVRVSATWAPPGTTAVDAVLSKLGNDGPEPLANAESAPTPQDTITLQGDLRALEAILIAGPD